MNLGRHLVVILAPLLVGSLLSSCTAGGCDPHRLAPVEEQAAGIDRATSCPTKLEVDGVAYRGASCPLRRALLGPVIAEDSLFVARSIDGVPRKTALAVRERNAPSEGCRGWKLFVDALLADNDRHAIDVLERRLRQAATLA